jgi:hypothetical protein
MVDVNSMFTVLFFGYGPGNSEKSVTISTVIELTTGPRISDGLLTLKAGTIQMADLVMK